MFYKFFDSFDIKTDVSVFYIGNTPIGTMSLYPSEVNPFINGFAYVRLYANGELFCDENLVKLLAYTDGYSEFMDFCFDVWKNKTNQKIIPYKITIPTENVEKVYQTIFHRNNLLINPLVE